MDLNTCDAFNKVTEVAHQIQSKMFAALTPKEQLKLRNFYTDKRLDDENYQPPEVIIKWCKDSGLAL